MHKSVGMAGCVHRQKKQDSFAKADARILSRLHTYWHSSTLYCYVPNYKSFLLTEAERKHVRRRARFQQHRDASCHQVFFLLQGKAPKEIHAITTETLGEHAPSYATLGNWVAQFKRGDFSTCDAPRPGRPPRSFMIKFTS